jgi:transposase-like protein
MSELTDFITAYKNLSFSDRIVFYTTVSNDILVDEENLQSFLIETRMPDQHACIYCEGGHVVKNGTRKDGTQRYLCRDCGRSFIPSSQSVTSRTRKRLSVWADYLQCMMDQKTLAESAEKCQISMSTAFAWRHKILDSFRELADKVCLDGTVEADETFFNVSYKGNHRKSTGFTMPRPAHKRGNDVHTKGLSSEKVCVPCAVNDSGISYAKPAKLGEVSSDCIKDTFGHVISPGAVLCTDQEKAYLALAEQAGLDLIQMDTGCCISRIEGKTFGIQRINAYHNGLKAFIRRFHGVSTKHLGSYIIWNDLIVSSQRKRPELMMQLFGQILCARITRYNRDISKRPAVPLYKDAGAS